MRHLARIRHDSSFILHKLVVKPEGRWYVVGRREIEVYVKIPREGLDVLTLMRRGLRVEEIERRHDDLDVRGFIHSMIDHGFVAEVDHHPIFDAHHPHRRLLLPWLHPQHVRWLFSWPVYAVWWAMLLAALGVLVSDLSRFPSPQNFFFVESTFLLLLISTTVPAVMVLLHELWHFLAARSLGVSARFGVTRRAHYVVFFTDVTDLYAMPRRKRYRVMLAGMGLDTFLFSLFFLLHAARVGPIGLFGYLSLIAFFGVLWQFMLFLRTDIYYAAENFLRVENLHEKAHAQLLAWLRRARAPVVDHPREVGVVRIYTLFYALGFGLLLSLLVFYVAPIMTGLFVRSTDDVLRALVEHETGRLVEAGVWLVLFISYQTLFFTSLIREHKLVWNRYFLLGSLLLFIIGNYFITYFLLIAAVVLLPSWSAYGVAGVLGLLFGALFCWIIAAINKVEGRTLFFEWLFVPAAAAIFAAVLAKLLLIFPDEAYVRPLWLALAYAAGMLLSLAWHEGRKGAVSSHAASS